MKTFNQLLQELESRARKAVVSAARDGGRAEGFDESAELVKKLAGNMEAATRATKRRRRPSRYSNVPLDAIEPIIEMLRPHADRWVHYIEIEAWLKGQGIAPAPGTLEHILHNGTRDKHIVCMGRVYRINPALPVAE